MPRRSDLPKSRRHIMLYDEDWDFIMAEYGQGSAKPIGASEAICAIVHAKVVDLKARANAQYEAQIAAQQRQLREK